MIDTLRHGPIVELRLNRPPVNALDAALLDDLLDALVGAAESGARGIVLSGQPGMFSAGLDIAQAAGTIDAHGMRHLCSAVRCACRSASHARRFPLSPRSPATARREAPCSPSSAITGSWPAAPT